MVFMKKMIFMQYPSKFILKLVGVWITTKPGKVNRDSIEKENSLKPLWLSVKPVKGLRMNIEN